MANPLANATRFVSCALPLSWLLATGACGSSTDNPPANPDGAQDSPIEPDAPARQQVLGTWELVNSTLACGSDYDGVVASAEADPNTFLITYAEPWFGGPVTTLCTFQNATSFTCADVSLAAGSPQGCLFQGGGNSIAGSVANGVVTVSANQYNSAVGQQCPGGAQTCGPATGSSTLNVIAPN